MLYSAVALLERRFSYNGILVETNFILLVAIITTNY
jgi:hypothetical protein